MGCPYHFLVYTDTHKEDIFDQARDQTSIHAHAYVTSRTHGDDDDGDGSDR